MSFTRKLPPKPDRSAEFASYTPRPRAATMAAALHQAAPAVPKQGRHKSNAWRRAVASLPCVLCGKEGETQCAHRNEGKGIGIKCDDALSAALCVACHREIDSGGSYTRSERRERLDCAILTTIALLARKGLVIAR